MITKNDALTELSIELFANTIQNTEERLTCDKGALLNEIKHHEDQFNCAMAENFKQITDVARGLIRRFWGGHFDGLDGYLWMTKCDIDDGNIDNIINHNLMIINAGKRILKIVRG